MERALPRQASEPARRDPVDLLREGYAAFERTGRVPAEHFHPDVVLEEAETMPVGGTIYRGREGVERALEALREAFEDVRFDPEEFRRAGERVLVFLRLVATGRGSGVRVDGFVAHLFDFEDGVIRRWRVYTTRRAALAAAEDPAAPPRRGSALR